MREVDGNIARSIDAEGRATDYEYYANGWLSDVIAHRPSVAAGPGGYQTATYPNLTNHFTYSPFGQVEALTDPRGLTTVYERDELDRLIGWYEQPVPGATVDCAYDPAGQLIGVSNQQGQSTLYRYTQAGYVEVITYPSWTAGAGAIAGKEVQNRLIDFAGRILTQTDSELPGNIERAYDASGRLTFQREGNGFAYQLVYDADGHWTAVRAPSHECDLTVTRDALGRVMTLEDSAALDGSVRYDYTYQQIRGANKLVLQLFEKTVGVASIASAFEYDDRGAVSGLAHTVGGAAVFAQQLTHDLNGLLGTVRGDNPTTFSYDDLTQLIYESTLGFVCDYDEVGNRLFRERSAGASTPATFDQLNRMTDDPPTQRAFAYDPSGELSTVNGPAGPIAILLRRRMELLRRIELPAGVIEFLYDSERNLVQRTATLGRGRQAYRAGVRLVLGRAARVDQGGALHDLLDPGIRRPIASARAPADHHRRGSLPELDVSAARRIQKPRADRRRRRSHQAHPRLRCVGQRAGGILLASRSLGVAGALPRRRQRVDTQRRPLV